MSNEKRELTPKGLKNVAGGAIIPDGIPDEGSNIVMYDQNGNAVGTYQSLEEAKFYASGVCPLYKKMFNSKAGISNHIKAWASRQK